jgi:outer membrane lipoprotein carrier protein
MIRLVSLMLTLSLAPISAIAQTQPAADVLAQSLEQRYQRIHDFSADFTHTYRGGLLRTQATEQGRMAIKKPGMMRWEYTTPEKKLFVSDGRKIYSYIPQDRQVIVSDVPAEDEATTPALFLTGKGDIARDFIASFADASRGLYALKLVPRRAEQDYEYLVLIVDPATLQIRALTARDPQGGESTFTFGNLKENQGLSDKDFVFRIPRGVDVITDGRVSR